jgi:predicted branched-subunit amino acid permease
MITAWHSGVISGYYLGNLAPTSWSLDYAIPLSFIALLMPSLKTQKYILVALCSTCLSLVLKPMPYHLGMILTAIISILFASILTRERHK